MNPVRGLAFAGIVSPNFLPVAYPAPESIGFFLARFSPRATSNPLSAIIGALLGHIYGATHMIRP